jgi:hypothetical protein
MADGGSHGKYRVRAGRVFPLGVRIRFSPTSLEQLSINQGQYDDFRLAWSFL